MKMFICLDDNLGMLNSGKRLSRDLEIMKSMDALRNGDILYVYPGSKKLFRDFGFECAVSDFAFEMAQSSDNSVFIENPDHIHDVNQCDYVIIYYWNECYQSDKFFLYDMNQFNKIKAFSFPGERHEKITCKIFERAGSAK